MKRKKGARGEAGDWPKVLSVLSPSEDPQRATGPQPGHVGPLQGSFPSVLLYNCASFQNYFCICAEILTEDGVCCTSEESQQNIHVAINSEIGDGKTWSPSGH